MFFLTFFNLRNINMMKNQYKTFEKRAIGKADFRQTLRSPMAFIPRVRVGRGPDYIFGSWPVETLTFSSCFIVIGHAFGQKSLGHELNSMISEHPPESLNMADSSCSIVIGYAFGPFRDRNRSKPELSGYRLLLQVPGGYGITVLPYYCTTVLLTRPRITPR